MRQAARRHRNPRYRRLASLQNEFDAALLEEKWSAVLRLLEKNWLEPLHLDDLFELYVLVLVLVVLEKDLGLGPPKPGLIRRGRKQVAKFEPPGQGIRVDVYFDQSPASQLGCSSEYAAVVGSYKGLRPGKHRPDVTLRIHPAGAPARTLLVEAKKTEDDRYQRDSVYKVLAYLRDFKELWQGLPGQRPKGALVFPASAGVEPTRDDTALDLVLAGGTRERIRQILQPLVHPVP
jgi:hypothetical protein